MTNRAYTLSETDKMRRLVAELYEMEHSRWTFSNGSTFVYSSTWYVTADNPAPISTIIEERVRTYLVAGIEPLELEIKLDRAKELSKESYALTCKEAEEVAKRMPKKDVKEETKKRHWFWD